MTLDEILTKYDDMKTDARELDRWSSLDEFVEELAQLASGTPLIPGDHPDQVFDEVHPARKKNVRNK